MYWVRVPLVTARPRFLSPDPAAQVSSLQSVSQSIDPDISSRDSFADCLADCLAFSRVLGIKRVKQETTTDSWAPVHAFGMLVV
ncbi:hypothetical protein BaRGS_00029124 [Batillaria attramentaria]|uniref:Uncharacterized protein n=1 Tax=Batillaria attramentaria TaxID=370345 RepID=A0ABD0JXF9_9CAEN